jgi:putative sugar O-methyltransferase
MSNDLDLLHRMLEDMDEAPELYRATTFWRRCADEIVSDFERLGPESFRRHPSALRYYVPTYAELPASRRLASRVARVRSSGHGIAPAERHWAIFRAGDPGGAPDLTESSESQVGEPAQQFEFDGHRHSQASLRYLRALAMLKKHARDESLSSVMEIGGGYGSLGEILLKGRPPWFYVDVDIPPVSFVATWYLRRVFGPDAVAGYDETRDLEVIDLDALRRRYRAVVLCAWQLPRVVGSVDVFVNSVSFQEMEPRVVQNYASLVQPRTQHWMVLRNAAAGQRRDGATEHPGVDAPITREDYPRWFDAFERVASDGTVFGDTSDSGWVSEVSLYRRRAESQATV